MTTHYFKNKKPYPVLLLHLFLVLCFLFQASDGFAQRRYNARKENTTIALGANTSYQIINGTLWAWGRNNYGQFGNGTTTDSNVPVQVGTDTDWMCITAGNYFVVALKANGTLWSWGQNAYGQLGYITNSNSTTPKPIGIDTWLSISAGANHVVAIKSDGTLWGWGDNRSFGGYYYGGIQSNTPMTISSEKWIYISANAHSTLAIKADGGLYGWGDNDIYRQLYGKTSTWLNYPLLDAGPWLAVDIGTKSGAGIKADGSLWTWGYYTGNGNHTGDGTVSVDPVRIGIDTWSNVAIGSENNTFAIKTDGTLWSWGDNFPGSIGDGTNSARYVPYQIGIDTWVSLAGCSGGTHAAAIKADGSLWVWGLNFYGEVGNGTNTSQLTPVNISIALSLDSWQVITSGYYHSAGIKSNGTLWTWGNNNYGHLGDAGTLDRNCPVQIGTDKWIAVSPGINHTLGIKADGTLWAWGYNGYAQLGDGTYTNRNTPTQIGTDRWICVSAGYRHSAAIRSDGKLFTWGYNPNGQLGDNTTNDRIIPTQIGSATWVSVTAGNYHTAGIQSDGSLWAWGSNAGGIIGDGTSTDRLAPVKIGTDTWVKISAGQFHTHAIKSDGALYSWGYNAYNHLGDGTTTNRNTPILIGTGNTWRFISASKYAGGAAIKSDGTLWGWGGNDYGQIGDGTNSQRSSPVSIPDLTQYGYRNGEETVYIPLIDIPNKNWIMVATGYESSMAVKSERTPLYSTGTNGYGEMARNKTVTNVYGVNASPYNSSPADYTVNHSICSGQSTVLTAGAIGGKIAWYTSASGGSPLTYNLTYTTPMLTTTTTYYVQSTAYCTTPNVRTPVTITVNSCARLVDEGELSEEESLRAFPNPNTGSFTLIGKQEGIYTIVNELGQKIQTVALSNGNQFTAEISNIPNGFYSVLGPDQRSKQRIVVMR